MLGVLFSLFMAMALFMLSIAGFAVALAMYNKSRTICRECKEELDKE